jgi:hypothetical protein
VDIEATMSFKEQDDRSNLFLMRLHAKGAGDIDDLNGKPWFGTVQRVVSGETYDFCGWAELIECLGAMLDDEQAGNARDGNSMSGDEK